MKRILAIATLITVLAGAQAQNFSNNYLGLGFGGGYRWYLPQQGSQTTPASGFGLLGELNYRHYGQHFGFGLGLQAISPAADFDVAYFIPVSLRYRTPLASRWQLEAGIGAALGLYQKLADAAALGLDLGASFATSRHTALYMGLYGTWAFATNATASSGSAFASNLGLGLKVGFGFGWDCKKQIAHDAEPNLSTGRLADAEAENAANLAAAEQAAREEAAHRAQRRNARLRTNSDLRAAVDSAATDLEAASAFASAAQNDQALQLVADASAKIDDAARAHDKGNLGRAYDLYNEAYADLAQAYAAAATTYCDTTQAAIAAAALYAETATMDGLGCARASANNARLNATAAAAAATGSQRAAGYTQPAFASHFAEQTMQAALATSNPDAITEASDAQGKAYRGSLAECYAACARAYAAIAATEQSAQLARQAAEAARMNDLGATYRFAVTAREIGSNPTTPIPEPQPVATTNNTKEPLMTVVLQFDDGDCHNPKVDAHGNQQLKAMVQRLQADGQRRIVVYGHTDDQGSPTGNRRCGQMRADAVRAILIDYGAPADRVGAISRGATHPAQPNTTPEGRSSNRRAVVELQ